MMEDRKKGIKQEASEAKKEAVQKTKEFFKEVKGKSGDFYENTKATLKQQYGDNAEKFDAKVNAKIIPLVLRCKQKSHIKHCIDCEDHPSKKSPFPCKIARWEPIES